MNTDKDRINLNMSIMDIVLALSEGNPGALTVCLEGTQKYPSYDPDSALAGLTPLLSLDTNRVYGPNIWVLYKDICGESYLRMFALFRATQLGLINCNVIKNAIAATNRYERHGLDLDKIVADVKNRLPRFGVDLDE